MFELFNSENGKFKGDAGTCSRCGVLGYGIKKQGQFLCKACIVGPGQVKRPDPLFDENYQKQQRAVKQQNKRDEWFVPENKDDLFN